MNKKITDYLKRARPLLKKTSGLEKKFEKELKSSLTSDKEEYADFIIGPAISCMEYLSQKEKLESIEKKVFQKCLTSQVALIVRFLMKYHERGGEVRNYFNNHFTNDGEKLKLLRARKALYRTSGFHKKILGKKWGEIKKN